MTLPTPLRPKTKKKPAQAKRPLMESSFMQQYKDCKVSIEQSFTNTHSQNLGSIPSAAKFGQTQTLEKQS